MVATFSPAVGSHVWVEDPDEAWLDGEVVEINGDQIKVLCTSGKQVTVKASNIYPKDVEAPASGVEDMTRLAYLHEPGVPLVLIQKIHTQTFSFINVQLFNSLLLRKECCTFSNGEFVKAAGLAELELWCGEVNEYAGPSWEELKHIRQAVGFLVIHQKYRVPYDDIVHDLCPILSVQQLYRICTLYWDDCYNTRSVSQEVISSMRALMTEESNDADSDSFLLDDNSSIPFSIDEISDSMHEKDFASVKPAIQLLDNSDFVFLH